MFPLHHIALQLDHTDNGPPLVCQVSPGHDTACCCVCCRSETVRLIKRLHQYDVMRANKAPFAFGLEPRVPFLDKAFLDTSMSIAPADKMVSLIVNLALAHLLGLLTPS